ncbi:hypothetical protein KEM48_008785 [Puccinia striiformis f. sp. tritici PST-130]|nr:hypothetical protein KEM48_008785 [Puccinia striiformis f. sp. tritici PST-130]
MLTNSKLLKIHQKLTTACSMFASYTSHFTKSAHSFNVAFQDGRILNDVDSQGRLGLDDENEDNDEDEDDDDDEDDDSNEQKRKSIKKKNNAALASKSNNKPSNQEIYDKFLLAENALKKFEQNFNHHSQVHVDMVTYFASSENIALLALAVRLTSVKALPVS